MSFVQRLFRPDNSTPLELLESEAKRQGFVLLTKENHATLIKNQKRKRGPNKQKNNPEENNV